MCQRETDAEGRHEICHRDAGGKDTGVVNDTQCSVSNYDTCSLATSKQHNHAKVAIHEAA